MDLKIQFLIAMPCHGGPELFRLRRLHLRSQRTRASASSSTGRRNSPSRPCSTGSISSSRSCRGRTLPAFFGGPVQTERGFVLHGPPKAYSSTLPITPERLKRDLNIADPVGFIDVSFYRDDFEKKGLHPESSRPTSLRVDGGHIMLVDDVLYTGRTTRAAINELFDYGRPAGHAGGAGRPRRARAADGGRIVGATISGRRTVARAGARRRRPTQLTIETTMLNPQLNKNGELQHLLTIEGLPKSIVNHILDTAASLRQHLRPRSEESAAHARQERVQPVLRKLDPHPHHLRDRRQAPVGRRDQPEHPASSASKGEIAARHHRQPGRDARRHVRGAPVAVGRALPDRAPRQAAHVHVVNAGDGRHAHPTQGLLDMYHDPPLQEGLHQPARWRSSATSCTAAWRAPTSTR